MGTVCGKCTEMQKSTDPKTNRRLSAAAPDSEDEEDEDDDEEGEKSASESSDENKDEYNRDVEDALAKTAMDLKRGKTMAMREVISTAKKVGVDNSKIREAEDRLEDHKKKQYREEVEEECKTFMASAGKDDADACASMIEKALGADVAQSVLQPIKDQHYELLMRRPLEEEERAAARERLRSSAREVVAKAIQGFSTVVLDMHEGSKVPATVTFDPPLANIVVQKEEEEEERAPLCSVKAYRASVADNLSEALGFDSLSKKEKDNAILINYDEGGEDGEGSWIFLQSSKKDGDQLVQALTLLRLTAPNLS